MNVTLTVAPGIELRLAPAAAARLRRELSETLDATTGATHSQLNDTHPLWDRHSGGDGHSDPDWGPGDAAIAEAFYATLRGKAKLFLDLLLDEPGRQRTVDDLIDASAGEFTSSRSIAGAINGLRLPHDASGRRYPFYWWKGTPTSYAVKPSVAALFNAARAKGIR